jgi:hypothetical protein
MTSFPVCAIWAWKLRTRAGSARRLNVPDQEAMARLHAMLIASGGGFLRAADATRHYPLRGGLRSFSSRSGCCWALLVLLGA